MSQQLGSTAVTITKQKLKNKVVAAVLVNPAVLNWGLQHRGVLRKDEAKASEFSGKTQGGS